MLRKENKNVRAITRMGQAAVELAVFGAILIFVLGTIVRSAVGNSYAQNQNFKAMRMALLASWEGTGLATGQGATANLTHNSASVLFIEDRLSPDINKYGDMDRVPFVAQGSGMFSYNLMYPWQPGVDPVSNMIPIMDIFINGQHFPFTTANFFTNVTIPFSQATCGGAPDDNYPLSTLQCQENQCWRNSREWAGGTVNESQFEMIIPVTSLTATTGGTMISNASAIFAALQTVGLIVNVTGTDLINAGSGLTANPSPLVTKGSFISSIVSGSGQNTILNTLNTTELNQIQSILQDNMAQYKIFYTHEPNGSPQWDPGSTDSRAWDLKRNGLSTIPVNLRPYVAWQWSMANATSPGAIQLDPTNNQYPTWDIDGRLKEVSVYSLSQNSKGEPVVSYMDSQGGDIDGTWDMASCTPKPGLQATSEIYTYTKDGTYLQIKEGKGGAVLLNPETDQYVRSVNQRDTIDLIQRTIRLSNNTGDFCNGATPQASVNNSPDPNPVTACITADSSDNCFSGNNSNGQIIAQTCYDQHPNVNSIFVRSRLEDQRGHYWMTNTSGQMGIK